MNDRSLQGQYAGFVSRAVGLAIDVLISTVSVAIVSWFLITVMGLFGINVTNCPRGDSMTYWWSICYISSIMLVSFAALFFPVYLLLFWTLAGETPGMRVMGVRVVRRDGRRVNLWVAIKRLFGYFVCFFTLGLGFLWVLLDDQRQGLHDMIAGTVVIYAWNARLRTQFITRMQRKALRQNDRRGGPRVWRRCLGRQGLSYDHIHLDQYRSAGGALRPADCVVSGSASPGVDRHYADQGRDWQNAYDRDFGDSAPTTAVMASNPSIRGRTTCVAKSSG
ncbi:MAG: RDD family protein [Anaerolineae bacterium]|nr:MAG: RDD family protein [Anaerolineae bacterium]